MSAADCDADELIREVRELIGKPEPVVNGRTGWTRWIEQKTLGLLDRPVETVATTDVL